MTTTDVDVETVEVPEALDTAADHIETHGWYCGDYFGEGMSACALGGIAVGTGWAGESANDERWDADTIAAEPATIAFLEFLYETQPDELVVFYHDGGASLSDQIVIGDPEVDVVKTVGNWNDASQRTARQVITALRDAARSERERREGESQ